MLITLLPDTLDQLLIEATPPRTAGLHLSQIIHSICASLEPNKYSGPINPLYTDPGFTFERVMETAWASRLVVWHPGEFECDGIACSPDGVRFDKGDARLVELKMTEMSTDGFPDAPKFRKWIWQMGSYCYVMDLAIAELHVLFLRGDYKKVRRDYRAVEIRWEPGETEKIWSMIRQHADEKGMRAA